MPSIFWHPFCRNGYQFRTGTLDGDATCYGTSSHEPFDVNRNFQIGNSKREETMKATVLFVGLFMIFACVRHHWMRSYEIGYRSARTRFDYVAEQAFENLKVLAIWAIIILTFWAAYELLCFLKDYLLENAPRIDIVNIDPDR
jgi:hypothetical protein